MLDKMEQMMEMKKQAAAIKKELEGTTVNKYVIWDEQTGRLMQGTDENPMSFKTCVDCLISYHSVDHTKEELKTVRKQYNNFMEYADINIVSEDEFYFGSY